MDNNNPSLDDEEVERRLLVKAVEEALNDPRPAVPHEIFRQEIIKKIEDLDKKVAATTGK